MNEARRRTKILLLQRKLTIDDLARGTGLQHGTIQNLLSGLSKRARARQAITNFLGTEIFDGIRPTERHYTFPAGLSIELETGELAAQWQTEFTDCVRGRGKVITFIKPTPATFSRLNEWTAERKAE